MTLGEKLSKARKENNYTQEQLAEVLGVSRQSISKWESNLAYPETEKLIRISELFGCSLDYLLKENIEEENTEWESGKQEEEPFIEIGYRTPGIRIRERKSEKTIFGMPLWHIAKNAKGFLAVGLHAEGVIAVGMRAKGILSIGMLSMGLLSFGLASLGLISVGCVVLGLLSVGCFAGGFFVVGSVSLGVISIGAVAVGDFSLGALAIGRFFAMGDHAQAMIAAGDTKAAGTLFEKAGELTSEDIQTIKNLLDANVPSYLSMAKEFIKMFL